MDMAGDVRTKMCIKPNEEDFTTIYHELGHVYYYLAYNKLPPIFQAGANDGFHEAIGDTIVMSMTPKYLESIGLVDAQQQTHEALINAQIQIGRANVCTPVTNAQLVCRLPLVKKKNNSTMPNTPT